MHVLVTGGTGFVGSHTVAALVKHGHRVRVLARSPERIEPALGPLGCAADEVVIGDVTDPAAVDQALAGCEAVIHAANVFSFHPRQVESMRAVNERSTELVLAAAVRRGLDPIVYVSSYMALLPTDQPLAPESEVGNHGPAYSRSKAAADRIARRFQSEGAPVVISYPGSVWGPHDPHLGESNQLALTAMKGRARLVHVGLLLIADVRDVAEAHAAVMEPGLGPRRYLVIGHSPGLGDVLARLGKLAGRNLWSIPVPSPVALVTGRVVDWAKANLGLKMTMSYEGAWLVAKGTEADSTAARNELGVEFTPLDTTLADTGRWLFEAGHLTRRQAGNLAA